MRPGITDEMVERAANDVSIACYDSGMDDDNCDAYVDSDDMLSLADYGCRASDVYLLAEFALETLRSKK